MLYWCPPSDCVLLPDALSEEGVQVGAEGGVVAGLKVDVGLRVVVELGVVIDAGAAG